MKTFFKIFDVLFIVVLVICGIAFLLGAQPSRISTGINYLLFAILSIEYIAFPNEQPNEFSSAVENPKTHVITLKGRGTNSQLYTLVLMIIRTLFEHRRDDSLTIDGLFQAIKDGYNENYSEDKDE